MTKALEGEMLDFFGHQYDEAWKVDGNEIAKLYCAPTITVRGTGPSIVFNRRMSLRGSSKGCSTPTEAKASLVGPYTTLWSFQSATEVPWRP